MPKDSRPDNVKGSHPTYPFAVYYSDEEERNIPVYLPEQYMGDIPPSLLEHGEVYDPEQHDGRLMCPDGCAAHLHVATPYETAPGKVILSHFKSDEGAIHQKDCKYKPDRDLAGVLDMEQYRRPGAEKDFHHRRPSHLDDSLGHPSTAGVYAELKGRARTHFSKAADFVRLIKKGRFDQIREMILIDQHQQIEETDFFVRYTRKSGAKPEKRFINLFRRLESLPPGSSLPCLMEFQIVTGTADRKSNAHKSVTSRQIFDFSVAGDKIYDGPKRYLVPRALPFPAGSDMAEINFREAGNYLVLGYVSLAPAISRDDNIFYYMDIEIHHPDQVVKADIEELISSRKRSRREIFPREPKI